MPFIAGWQVGVSWISEATQSQAALQVTSHSWSEMVDKIDVTNTGSLGIQALLRGIFRGQGNVKGDVNTTLYPWNPTVGITAGANGLLVVSYGTQTALAAPSMIIKVNQQSAVEGKVSFDFDIELNSLAAVAPGYLRPA